MSEMLIEELISTQGVIRLRRQHQIVGVVRGGVVVHAQQGHQAAEGVHRVHVPEWNSDVLVEDIIEVKCGDRN